MEKSRVFLNTCTLATPYFASVPSPTFTHSYIGCQFWQLHISYHIHSTFKKIKHHTVSHLLIPFSGMGKHTDGSYIRLSASLRLKSSKPICMARLAPPALGPKNVYYNDIAHFLNLCSPHSSPESRRQPHISL